MLLGQSGFNSTLLFPVIGFVRLVSGIYVLSPGTVNEGRCSPGLSVYVQFVKVYNTGDDHVYIRFRFSDNAVRRPCRIARA